MIDYDKLQEAHTLAQKLTNETGMRADIISVFMDGEPQPEYVLVDYRNDQELYYTTIDLLIAELRKLTQPAPKYKPGDTWWYIDECNEPCSLLINETNKDWHRNDEEWFPTKAALIEAQINYWYDLKEDWIKCDKCGINRAMGDCWMCARNEAKEPEYCNVSGIKLGKREPETTTGCHHAPDYNVTANYTQHANSMVSHVEFKCIKCGEFYR